MKNNRTSYKLNKKVLISILAVTLVAVLGVGVVFAYLSGKAPAPVNNSLKADQDPQPTIFEGTDNPVVVSNVDVEIPSDVKYYVYVRAAIVVNWVKIGDHTQIHANKPERDTDYILQLSCDGFSGSVDKIVAGMWTPGSDGFYYYSSPVGADTTPAMKTNVLINNCFIKSGANIPEGYTLDVQVASQVIQAIGSTDNDNELAVVNAWHVDTKPTSYTIVGGNPNQLVLIYKGPFDENNLHPVNTDTPPTPGPTPTTSTDPAVGNPTGIDFPVDPF